MQVKQTYTRTLRLSGDDLDQLLGEADFIMKRENWSFDVYIKNAIKEYNLRHGQGNNSFQLDTFGVTWTKAVAVDKCGFKNCGKTAIGVGLFIPRKQTFGLCAEHFVSAKANPHVWADLKFPKQKGIT
ncbi:MAG: hypothetical protein WC325_09460 [Candidatus Bathyarchaeia archaeon]